MNKTPAEAREIVANALESGEYTQGGTYLEFLSDDGFRHCCLGVATREFMKHESVDIDVKLGLGGQGCTAFDCSSVSLCITVRDWLGFRRSSGAYNLDQGRTALSINNDNGMPFIEIAELFRNPPEGLLA